MTAVKIVIATVLLLASASPMQAGEAGNEICPPGFNEMFNVNEPGCTFCSAPSECQISCLGPPACF